MPLHVAVKYHQGEAFLSLLDLGMLVNIRDREGGTQLFYAIEFEYTNFVQFIIEGADVNLRYTGFGNVTPLNMTVSGGNMDIIGILLRSGANVYIPCSVRHETSIHWASRQGSVEILELMSKFGSILSMQTADKYDDRPIHVAVKYGHLPAVMWLVDKGVSVNCTNNTGHTPLHTAVFYGQFDTASYLLQQCSQVYFRTNHPELCTSLNIAVQFDQLDMIDLLILYRICWVLFHNGSLLHSKFNTQLLITVHNSSRILTHV
jgi:ankyrin repeat protein